MSLGTKKSLFVGHSGRMDAKSRKLTLVFLGQFFVFLAAMFHDEFAYYLVETGRVAAENSHVVEIVVGMVLFVVWIIVTARMASLLNSVKSPTSYGDEAQ
ncbi:hypothetical protein ACFE33_07975 [Falsihalocynthiibacter sp. SS001]|uniref:hypothetical protein n=1 Tax=Falsihalocynthiibacter sp. SS001 TaxID=3349698 RepID=UPI0036D3A654